MKQTNKSNKKVPVAVISLLPVECGKKRNATGPAQVSSKRVGHYEQVTVRHRTYWRTGSETKVTFECFETYRKWVWDRRENGGVK